MKNTQDYRPDIDGLRAIAVLAVILVHAKVSFLSGGFIGVDVFFVISGFLITRIILAEIDSGKFSFLTFYKKRMLRIFPALFFVLACAFVFAKFILISHELRNFLESFTATSLFVSNIYFLLQQKYFAPSSATIPLLHTWSLAVEEQFYILFPLILFGLSRFCRRHRRKLIWFLAISSFALNLWLVNHSYTEHAFYLMPARIWELLLGSFCAMHEFNFRKFNQVFSLSGLLMVVLPMFFYGKTTVFPGFYALLPCLGAALIIYSGKSQKTLVYSLLSFRPLVFIGLISYSLYLWHWPVIVFTEMRYGQILSLQMKLAVISISVLLATVSWKFVEKPFRRSELEKPITKLFKFLLYLVSFVMLCCLGINLSIDDSLRSRNYASYLKYDIINQFRAGDCFLCSPCDFKSKFNPNTCLKRSKTKKNFLLMGDSHAGHLWYGLNVVHRNINFMQVTATGCKPLVNVGGDELCKEVRDKIFRREIKKLNLDGVILASKWSLVDIEDIKRTVKYLKRFVNKVYVIGPIPQYEYALPKLLVQTLKENSARALKDNIKLDVYRIDRALEKELLNTEATYISLYKTICPKGPGSCNVVDKYDAPLQFDYGHLTKNGSIWVAKKWKTEIQ